MVLDPSYRGFYASRGWPTERWIELGLEFDNRVMARRIEAASRYVPLERLAVSPQCGFATSVLGNALTIDAERAKLALVAAVARQVWG
jgi:5-methyltetrahydropteroyltriglutamate--homocysteine methyltransferase